MSCFGSKNSQVDEKISFCGGSKWFDQTYLNFSLQHEKLRPVYNQRLFGNMFMRRFPWLWKRAACYSLMLFNKLLINQIVKSESKIMPESFANQQFLTKSIKRNSLFKT